MKIYLLVAFYIAFLYLMYKFSEANYPEYHDED